MLITRVIKLTNLLPLSPLVSWVNSKSPAVHFMAVHVSNSIIDAVRVSKFNETETFRSAGFPVLDNFDRVDVAVPGESVTELLFGSSPGDVTDKDRSHFIYLLVFLRF